MNITYKFTKKTTKNYYSNTKNSLEACATFLKVYNFIFKEKEKQKISFG